MSRKEKKRFEQEQRAKTGQKDKSRARRGQKDRSVCRKRRPRSRKQVPVPEKGQRLGQGRAGTEQQGCR